MSEEKKMMQELKLEVERLKYQKWYFALSLREQIAEDERRQYSDPMMRTFDCPFKTIASI